MKREPVQLPKLITDFVQQTLCEKVALSETDMITTMSKNIIWQKCYEWTVIVRPSVFYHLTIIKNN